MQVRGAGYNRESLEVLVLETLLADSNQARDRYHADYLEAHQRNLRLEAKLEQLRSGQSVDKCLFAGNVKRLGRRMCNDLGNTLPGSGDVMYRAAGMPMRESPELNMGSFPELSGCAVAKNGQIVAPTGNVVGRLVCRDPKILLVSLEHEDGDKRGRSEHWEKEAETRLNPIWGRRVGGRGNVVPEEDNAIGMWTGGGARRLRR